jgi:hypothetical protein
MAAKQWKPILKELVNVQRNQKSSKTYIDQSSGRIMIAVTIPLTDLGKRKWSSVIGASDAPLSVVGTDV